MDCDEFTIFFEWPNRVNLVIGPIKSAVYVIVVKKSYLAIMEWIN
jgi:hypothetical protein